MLRTNRLLLLLATVSAISACSGGDQPVTTRDSTPSNQTDTTAPLAPTGLSGTPMSSIAVSLSWTASSDNVGVTSYVVSRDGAQIAQSAMTSYVDSGLAAATTYQYAVAALDAAGNTSQSSPSINVTTSGAGTTADTTAPSQPGSFTAAAAGSTSANLSWTASTDNVGVTVYVLKRNGVQIATPTTTTFADTGLSVATTYTYTVAARDAAGNTSTAASASVTLADTTAPSQPASFTAAPAGATAVNLSWGASTDNVGVTGYIVKRNGTQIATPTATSFADTGLTAATTYTYTVVARDAAGNQSTAAGASATTSTLADTTAPSQPGSFTAAAAGSTSANLSWTASTDNVGVTVYVLKRNGVQIATPTTTTFADTGLSVATTYTYTVAARDAAGNTSTAASASVTLADTTAPSQPASFTAAAPGSTGANLSWTVSTDNVGVTGYVLKRNGVQIATPTATTFADTGLTATTTYTYTVAARDAAGNTSTAASASVTTAPTPPSNSATLTWDALLASNLSGYRVYFGTAPGTYLQPLGQGVSVGNVTTYIQIGLSSATRYYFAVTATDSIGDESGYSNEVFKDIP